MRSHSRSWLYYYHFSSSSAPLFLSENRMQFSLVSYSVFFSFYLLFLITAIPRCQWLWEVHSSYPDLSSQFQTNLEILAKDPTKPQFLWLWNFLCMIYQILLIHHDFPANSGFKPEHHIRLSLLTHPHIQRTTMFFLLRFLQASQTLHSTTSSSYLHTRAMVSYLLSPWLCSPSASAVYTHWQSEFS